MRERLGEPLIQVATKPCVRARSGHLVGGRARYRGNRILGGVPAGEIEVAAAEAAEAATLSISASP
jgi:hypothetical protein